MKLEFPLIKSLLLTESTTKNLLVKTEGDDILEIHELYSPKGPNNGRCGVIINAYYTRRNMQDLQRIDTGIIADIDVEGKITDESFDHAFGTESAYGYEIVNVDVLNVDVAADEDSFIALEPKQVEYVSNYIKNTINKLHAEEWQTLIEGDSNLFDAFMKDAERNA